MLYLWAATSQQTRRCPSVHQCYDGVNLGAADRVDQVSRPIPSPRTISRESGSQQTILAVPCSSLIYYDFLNKPLSAGIQLQFVETAPTVKAPVSNRWGNVKNLSLRYSYRERLQHRNILHAGDAFAALTKLQWKLCNFVPAIERRTPQKRRSSPKIKVFFPQNQVKTKKLKVFTAIWDYIRPEFVRFICAGWLLFF